MQKKSAKLSASVVALLVIFALSSVAQQRQPAPDRVYAEGERIMQGPEDGPPLGPPPPGDFIFLATEMSFVGTVVKGAPYSAQAVTESTQILADGNRIVNKSVAAIYRDSAGRTRREQALRALGGFANGGEPPQTIFINDPVSGTSYTLDPRTHLAHKLQPMKFRFAFKTPTADDKGAAPLGTMLEAMLDRVESAPPGTTVRTGPESSFIWGWQKHQPRTEYLGKQNIEGVEAEGTRSTLTIPAGEIGNERPIDIVNERWYSPELQTVVMTRQSDPRSGEATYRLTNINRSEPAKSLFEVPADYTLKSGPEAAGEAGASNNVMDRPAGGISGGVLNSKAVSLPAPSYPAVAKAARASGDVTVQVTIDEEGNVVYARAVSGHPLLQSAAVAAARQAKFPPTRLSGQPVKVQGSLIYTFANE